MGFHLFIGEGGKKERKKGYVHLPMSFYLPLVSEMGREVSRAYEKNNIHRFFYSEG